MKINIKRLGLSLALPLLAGFIGSAFTTPSIPTWYATLAKPAFNPPNWLFGPVWTLLYLLMGCAFYLILQNKSQVDKFDAYKIFFAQLILNTTWSIVFFGLHAVGLALLVIAILWIAIYKNIVVFGKIDVRAGYLLYPYIAWVSFATILNFAILQLN